MTYKEKFEASESRAHYKNIATKILREMTVLRSLVENSPIAPRRWIWELIQNAKDVHPKEGVKIIIDYQHTNESSFISFRHNGNPFTADNIRFLIEQISSKDRGKNSEGLPKTTGKFGTGFLTTHLLSEQVLVKGVAKEPELDYRKFKLELDRSGYELDEITDSVQKSKDSVQDLDEKPVYDSYIEGAYNTSFFYFLTDSIGHTVAKKGLEDLKNCLPYTFVFVEDITTVRLKHSGLIFKNTDGFDNITQNIKVVVIKIENSTKVDFIEDLSFIVLSKNLTSITIPIKKQDRTIEILPINEDIPKLFCDFPLIGTEIFPFPAIINNPNFNPTDPRDGVYLTTSNRVNPLTEANKEYIKEAIELYFDLLQYASQNNWKNLHLLATIKPLYNSPNWIDADWYNEKILKPIRTKLLCIKLVRTANNDLKSIQIKDGQKYIWFPSSSNSDNRKSLWDISKYWFPHVLPNELDIELWNKLTWKECGKLTSDQLAEFIEKKETLKELSKVLVNIETCDWLEMYFAFIQQEKDEYDTIINNRAIFPNQHGDLVKLSKLWMDNGDIGDELKDILYELGVDIKADLMHEKISFDLGDEKIRNISYAVKEINTEVNDKANDREVAKNYKGAFKKLLLWFQKNPNEALKQFPNLYRHKHLLYNDDEILENINKAEQLNDLLNEFNVSDLSQIRELISLGQDKPKSILPVTEKILESMGISSIEEWKEAIKDKNLESLFCHESTPTTDMFVYVHELIKKAKKNVIDVLHLSPEYDLTNLDTSTAPTTLAGVLKYGREISIIVRPAYNNEVIIYYGSEKDILDYEPSELWIDDDLEPRQITLGHILKSANITKFPI